VDISYISQPIQGPGAPPPPLVERVAGSASAPKGYEAYIVRVWGSNTIGRAKTIVYNERTKDRITIVLGDEAGLEAREPLDLIGASIIYLPAGVHLDERVRALRAGPAVPPAPVISPAIVFVEDLLARTLAYNTYTFTYPGVVFTGTVRSVSLGNPGPRNGEGVAWSGGLRFSAESDFTEYFTVKSAVSRIRVPAGFAIPSELLPPPL